MLPLIKGEEEYHPSYKSYKSYKTYASYRFVFCTLLFTILYSLSTAPAAHAQTFIGPSSAAGVGYGAIGVDSSKNLSIGTSTVFADTKLMIMSTSTTSGGYAMRVMQYGGAFQVFGIRNDGRVAIGPSFYFPNQAPPSGVPYYLTVNGSGWFQNDLFASTLTLTNPVAGTINSTNVTPGVFNGNTGGNYAFNGNLGVNYTSQVGLPQTLSVAGGGYFSGNVGIGSTSPGFKLDVAGTVNATALYVNGSPYVGSQWTTTSTNIYYSTGNVGIGTTNPTRALTVVSSAAGQTTEYLQSTSVSGYSGFDFIASTGSTGGGIGYANASASLFAGNTYLYSGSGSNLVFGSNGVTERMRIDTNGNVGIGTTAPAYRLDVQAASGVAGSFNGPVIVGTPTANSHAATKSYVDSTVGGGAGSTVGYWAQSAAGNHIFNTNTGNVGVGTTSPGTLGTGVNKIVTSGSKVLDIVGGTGQDAFLRVMGGGGGTKGGLVIGNNDGSGLDYGQFTFDNSNNTFTVGQNYSSGYLGLGAGYRKSDLVILATNGNVGINSTTPGYKLDVVGTAQFSQPVIVGTPTQTNHAATKSYVDSAVTGGSGSAVGYWTLSGSNVYPNSTAYNVGIGVASAGVPLDVQMNKDVSAARSGILSLTNNFTGQNNGYTFSFGAYNSNGLYKSLSLTGGSSGSNLGFLDASGNLAASVTFGTNTAGTGHNVSILGLTGQTTDLFNVSSSTGASYLNVATSGNVGINTTNPTAKLYVKNTDWTQSALSIENEAGVYSFNSAHGNSVLNLQKTSGTTDLRISSADNSGSQISFSGAGTRGTLAANGDYNWYLNPNSAYGSGHIYLNDTSTGNVVMTGGGGNVGIGSASPVYKLNVVGTASFSQPVIVGTPTQTNHAATKSYVDSAITGGAAGGNFATLSSTGTSTFATTSGNVGIGTTGPLANLQINGAASTAMTLALQSPSNGDWDRSLEFRYFNGGTGAAIDLTQGNAAWNFKLSAASPMNFWTSNTQRMTIGTTGGVSVGGTYVATDPGAGNMIIQGNVGIGTTGPSDKLHIMGVVRSDNGTSGEFSIYNGATKRAMFQDQNGDTYLGTVSAQPLYLGAANATTVAIRDGGANGSMAVGTTTLQSQTTLTVQGTNTANSWAALKVQNGSATNLFTILNDGNVGINSTTPGYKLDVVGTAQFSQPVIVGTPTQTNHAATKSYVDSAVTGGSGSAVGYFTLSGSSVYPNSTAYNLGVGTTTAATKLRVSGGTVALDNNQPLQARNAADSAYINLISADTSSQIRIGDSNTVMITPDGGSVALGVQDTAGNRPTFQSGLLTMPNNKAIQWRNAANSGNLEGIKYDASNNLLLAGGSGNVGIGTTGPIKKLQVNGDFLFASANESAFSNDASYSTYLYVQPVTVTDTSGYVRLGVYDGAGTTGARDLALQPSGGNVGINSTAPGYKLDVVGTGSFSQPVIVGTPTASNHATTKSYVDSVLTAGTATSSFSILSVGTTTAPTGGVATFNGNVGIGTTAPAVLLDMGNYGLTSGNVANTLRVSGRWANGDGTFAKLALSNSADTGGSYFGINARHESNNYGVSADFTVNNNGAGATPLTAMTLQYNGNVGIGTTGPTEALHVQSPTRAVIKLLDSSGSNVAAFLTSAVGYATWGVNRNPQDGVYQNTARTGAAVSLKSYDSDSSIAFSVTPTNNSALSTAMLIDKNGNVGINSATPAYKLDVAGTSQFSQPVIVGTPTASNHATTKSYVDSAVTGGSGSAVGYFTLSGSNVYPNSAAYNVGVGTSTAAYKLDVSGTNATARFWDQNAAGATNIAIRAGSSQGSGHLLELQNSAGSSLGYISATGNGVFPAVITPDSWVYLDGTALLAKNTWSLMWSNSSAYTGTKDLGISRGAAGKLYVGNGTQGDYSGMLIASNIGVGSVSPGYNLDVVGTAQFSQPVIVGTPTATNHAATKNYVDSAVTGGSSGGNFATITSTGTSTFATTAGNVGIGTTSPSQTLQVGTTLYVDTANAKVGLGVVNPATKLELIGSIRGNGAAVDPNYGYQLTANYSATEPLDLYGFSGSNASQTKLLAWGPTSGLLLMPNGGNVGVGTTAPNEKFEVNGNVSLYGALSTSNSIKWISSYAPNNTVAYIEGARDANWGGIIRTFVARTGGGAGAQYGTVMGVQDDPTGYPNQNTHLSVNATATSPNQNGILYVGYGSNSANTRNGIYVETGAVLAATRGNVGIASTSPGYKLDVVGTAQFSQPVIVGTPTQGTHAATKSYVDSMFTGSGQWTTTSTSAYYALAGNVGIGSTNPQSKLDVAGTVKLTSAGGDLQVDGSGNTIIEL